MENKVDWNCIFLCISYGGSPRASQDVQESMIKFGRLLRLIDSYYVDTTNVDKLTDEAIVDLLSKLDPHSVYISKEEVEKMNEPLVGSFEGIGISFNILRDTLMVVTTIPGGPSEKVGLMPGDRIMAVDGKSIAGIGLQNSDVMDMLRGDKGTRVDLRFNVTARLICWTSQSFATKYRFTVWTLHICSTITPVTSKLTALLQLQPMNLTQQLPT